MKLKEKFKEVMVSIIPIGLIVLLVHFVFAPMPSDILWKFVLGAALLVLGQTVFLVGADISVLPMGEMVGSTITRSRKLMVMLVYGFLFGLMVTIAEPDLQVLAQQVSSVNEVISKQLLILCVSLGVGLFVAVSLLRILFRWKLTNILILLYIPVFAVALFTHSDFLAVAFDSGGVTTGPITVPFILALGIGVAAVRGGRSAEDDSFGLIALASLGPILSVLTLGLVFGGESERVAAQETAHHVEGVLASFLYELPIICVDVFFALFPMACIFVFFQFRYLHLARRKWMRMLVGLLLTYVGLVLFLTGVEVGFAGAGEYLGAALGALPYNWILIPIGLVIGFFVVYTEPAVRVLMDQVEQITGGAISRHVLLYSLALGVAASVGLSIVRVMSGFSLWFYLVPGYAVALVLSRVVPQVFVGIAFDSGGVASGPMTATFVLPLVLGVCSQVGGNPLTDAFGAVAMVAMTPLIAIQVLGLIYKIKSKGIEEQQLAAPVPDEDALDLSGLTQQSEREGV